MYIKSFAILACCCGQGYAISSNLKSSDITQQCKFASGRWHKGSQIPFFFLQNVKLIGRFFCSKREEKNQGRSLEQFESDSSKNC